MASVIVLLAFLSTLSFTCAERNYYTAAVYEHARFGTSNDSARLVVDTNLDFYKRAADIAKSKGSDIIVFPEYGIFSPGNRTELKDFLENIPDPKSSRVNPCEDAEIYSKRPILLALSCMAKNNALFVVANTGDIQNCEGDVDCPSDGVFHFNTNVVFDRDGTLIVRYHKEHLFYEFGMDLARHQQNSTFKTDFGTFATYICFDICYGRMSQVAQWPEVDGIMFSTMWLDQAPQMTSVEWWQSWALGNNATLLASNIQIPGYYAVGSGVFHGELGALGYTFNPDGVSKLVVANVPKSNSHAISPNSSITAITANESWDFKGDGKDVPMECSKKLLNDSTNIEKDYRCFEENLSNYTFTKLSGSSGHVEACQGGLCCSLDYSTNGLSEHFYLGVYNGSSYDFFERYSWCEEDCVLARCDAYGDAPCGTFPMKSDTLFYKVNLRANFSSSVVFPTAFTSGMRLLPLNEWRHESLSPSERSIQFENESGRKLLGVGFKGRCFEKDPPYKQ